MISRSLFLGMFLWAATAPAVFAEIYSWTDAQGTVHFTEDAGAVPPELRSTLRRSEEKGAPVSDVTPAPQAAEQGQQTPPPVSENDSTTTDLSTLKTRDQWQQELQKQEAALLVVRNRLEEIAAKVKVSNDAVETNNLLKDYRTLLTQYDAMKARYYQLVEAARKTGFQVDLPK